MPVLLGLVAVIVVAAGVLALSSSRRSRDGVDTFRRQIDALGPEARRGVVDQVQQAGRIEPRPINPPKERPGSDDVEDADDSRPGDEDGARGA